MSGTATHREHVEHLLNFKNDLFGLSFTIMAAGTFAYYCSGHGESLRMPLLHSPNGYLGYGHATRVSAFTCHLLNLPFERRPTVYIVSSAPEHVFSDSIALGAHYRFAEIDPVIVQPLA